MRPKTHLTDEDFSDVCALLEQARRGASEVYVNLYDKMLLKEASAKDRRRCIREGLASVFLHLSCVQSELEGLRRQTRETETGEVKDLEGRRPWAETLADLRAIAMGCGDEDMALSLLFANEDHEEQKHRPSVRKNLLDHMLKALRESVEIHDAEPESPAMLERFAREWCRYSRTLHEIAAELHAVTKPSP